MMSSLRTTALGLLGMILFLGMGIGDGDLSEEAPSEIEVHPDSAGVITHGPILGRPGPRSMGVWVRTSRATPFTVHYQASDGTTGQVEGRTTLERDNTGWVQLTGLEPETRYSYRVTVASSDTSVRRGTFTTWPEDQSYHHPELNPDGAFNFSFEVGSCNFQYQRGDSSYAMPVYQTMLEESAEEVDFQIMNGDYIYEHGRGTSVDTWKADSGPDQETPEIVTRMPDLVGVWENYKRYLDRSTYLAEWHREVPAFFMFDDHELLNDINGTGTPGHRSQRTVYRDIGVRGWEDYVGWSNPVPETRRSLQVGQATITEEGILTDSSYDFRDRDWPREPTLHVHWKDDHPASGVYAVEEVLGPHQVQLRPDPPAPAERISYSLAQQSYYSFEVSNAEFFVLDTRSHRDMHDKERPSKPDVSMLGPEQFEWLKRSMRQSEADVFFVVSPVSVSIPHEGDDKPNKDESWTSYLREREDLIAFWEGLDEPVLLLTGDLHNSMSIDVADGVHEYVAGPHNSPNHPLPDEGGRPPSGAFQSGDRMVDIQWSSFWHSDVPSEYQDQPYYVVVSVNNVYQNPGPETADRWAAYPNPQVVVRFYDGLTGELAYAESVSFEATAE